MTLANPSAAAESALLTFVTGRIHVSDDGRRLSAAVDSSPGFATAVVRALDDAGILVDNIEVRQPSLDDVFFSLTGGHIEESQEVVDVTTDPGVEAKLPEFEGADK